VHDALALLKVADESIMLALMPAPRRGTAPEPISPDSLVRHLVEHGVKATGDRLMFDPSSIEPAERLLYYLAETGADLLVMGAAGQQLGRSAAKRSLTRHVLMKMTVPVLLSF
jgi:nucleotide-binding universal stress UspA family protein